MVRSIWVDRFNAAITDWRKPAMTKIRPQPFIYGANSACPTYLGKISVCDGAYGNTGWLGLAQITLYGPHIQLGRALMNNTYFNTSTYNTIAYRQMVMCQEIGHLFGLKHVNEVYTNANTGSCMDYTNDPDGGAGGGSSSDPNNMHPNSHDYSVINSKHNHLHIGFELPAPSMPLRVSEFNPRSRRQFGDLEWSSADGRLARYEVDFGSGWKVSTFVIWVE